MASGGVSPLLHQANRGLTPPARPWFWARSPRRFQRQQGMARRRCGVPQRQVVVAACAPGRDLVIVMRAAGMPGRAGHLDGAQAQARVGQVGNHAIPCAQDGRIVSVGSGVADGGEIAADRRAVAVEQRAEIATIRQEVLLHQRVQPTPGPAFGVWAEPGR